MMRKLALALVLMCSMAVSVEAGLQSALTTALVGLSQVRINLPGVSIPLPPIPEGALFIDPITSTRGEGVFRKGPDFNYDSTTGSVTVFAPPMLGPADEFGVRREYSPQSIEIFGRDFFDDAPSIPHLTRYLRSEPEISQVDWQPLPFDDDDSSFVVGENGDDFNLYSSNDRIEVSVGRGRGFTGAVIKFSPLLTTELGSEIFQAEEDITLPNSIYPYLPQLEDTLPNVYFVVQYRLSHSNRLYPQQYSLLAVPQAGLFPNTSVPEPSSILLASFLLIILLTSRRFSTVA